MKEVVFIGYIDDKITFGPSVVLYNILEQFKNNMTKYKFINTYSNSILGKIVIFVKILLLLKVQGKVINVHSFGYKVPHYVYIISKFNKKNKYFLTLHGIVSEEAKYVNGNGSYKEFFKNKKKYEELEKLIIKNFPNIICVSNRQKKYIEDNFGRYNNINVVYNGVNIENKVVFNKTIEDDIKCIMAGGIYNRKNIFLLLKLAKEYNKINGKKLYLDIYGGYESEETLKKYNNFININNLSDYIKYKGLLEKKDLMEKYSESNLCFALSNYDTFNLTVIEAMSVATPVIVSEQCGVSEIIENDFNGYKINIDNILIDYLIQIIDAIIKSPSKYALLCKNAYKTTIKFSWNNIYNEYIKIFQI